MRVGWCAPLVAGLLLMGVPLQVRAQNEDASSSELAEARALFMAGQAAVDSGRWADAVDNFSRAYQLSEVPAALYNLGFALRALGRHREARDAFVELLESHPRVDRELRREARRYRDEAAARVAVLSVDGLDPRVRYTIRFDGTRVTDDGARPVRVEMDAGSHTLTVRSPEHRPWVWEGELEDGQRLAVDATLEAVVVEDGREGGGAMVVGGGGGATEPVEDEGGVLSSPLFWIVVGAVVIGGGVLGGYLVHDGMQLECNTSRCYEL